MVSMRSALPAARSNRSRHRRALAAGLGLAACAAAGSLVSGLSSTFVSGFASQPLSLHPRIALQAEAETSGGSVALVKVTEESKMTTAGLLGGVVGVLTGGVVVGAALFAATSYLSRKKDDDVANVLCGISAAGLDFVNFVGTKNDEFEVTSKLGSAITDAINSNDSTKNAYDTVSDTVTQFDKEVGIKDTIGTFLTSGTELASQAVSKIVDANEEYKPLDKIQEKLNAK